MMIIDAITRLDTLKFNTYTQEDKVEWLSRLDSMVKRLILDRHEGAKDVDFTGYDADTPLDTVLLVPAPYDEVYLRWMEAQIDYHNNEYARYNISATAYNTMYQEFTKHYKERHLPKQRCTRFLF